MSKPAVAGKAGVRFQNTLDADVPGWNPARLDAGTGRPVECGFPDGRIVDRS